MPAAPPITQSSASESTASWTTLRWPEVASQTAPATGSRNSRRMTAPSRRRPLARKATPGTIAPATVSSMARGKLVAGCLRWERASGRSAPESDGEGTETSSLTQPSPTRRTWSSGHDRTDSGPEQPPEDCCDVHVEHGGGAGHARGLPGPAPGYGTGSTVFPRNAPPEPPRAIHPLLRFRRLRDRRYR